jgi:hypothetical protein
MDAPTTAPSWASLGPDTNTLESDKFAPVIYIQSFGSGEKRRPE